MTVSRAIVTHAMFDSLCCFEHQRSVQFHSFLVKSGQKARETEGADNFAVRVFQHNVARGPARFVSGTAACLKGVQKCVADKRIVVARASIPLLSRNLFDPVQDFNHNLLRVTHGGILKGSGLCGYGLMSSNI